jgi:hypothetical protein
MLLLLLPTAISTMITTVDHPRRALTFNERCRRVAKLAMENAFACTPYKWQEDVLCHLLKMINCRLGLLPAPVFLCKPTGGGKKFRCNTRRQNYMVYNTLVVSLGGPESKDQHKIRSTRWFHTCHPSRQIYDQRKATGYMSLHR